MRIWPSFLVYGNWGGMGWSGGEWQDDPTQTKWNVPPVDAMDSLFKQHDFDIQHKIPYPHTNLYRRLLNIDNPTTFWGKCYRYAAIGAFFLLSKFE